MITAAVENMTERLEELKSFFPLHASELDTYADRRPLDPHYADYILRDQNGGVLFVAVRDRGVLIGYFVGFVQGALHYKSTMTCLQDIFFIVPEHRNGRPEAAIKMFRAVIAECKRRGVRELRVGHKSAHDVSALFKFLRFREVEKIYSMWLGDDADA